MTVDEKIVFAFDEDTKNINGRYLRATHVRETGVMLFVFLGILSIVFMVAGAWVLINWEFFTPDAIWSRRGGDWERARATLAIPTAVFAIPLFGFILVLTVLVLWPDGKGWATRDNAFARWYSKRRLKQKGFHHEEALFYFATYTRHSMPLDVAEDRFIVYLPGGRQNVPYKDMYKIFTYRDLYVIRAYQKKKSWDIILDLRNVDTQKRREFEGFMKAKKAEFMDAKLVHEPWIKSSMFAQY